MNDSILRVGILSMDVVFGEPQSNIQEVKRYIEKYSNKIDLLVLPELFSTGFSYDSGFIRDKAERDDGKTMSELQRLACEHGKAIAGSYLSEIEGRYFNRGFFIKPDGDILFYNKRHLFGLSNESKLLTAGNSVPLSVEYLGWKIAVVVCYDLRFPVWCRYGNGGVCYDMLVVVANWPTSRRYAWEHLLIARAIENQAIVVGANRSGTDEFGTYDNLTRVYDEFGTEVIGNDYGLIKIVELSACEHKEKRSRWPILNDADQFSVQH